MSPWTRLSAATGTLRPHARAPDVAASRPFPSPTSFRLPAAQPPMRGGPGGAWRRPAPHATLTAGGETLHLRLRPTDMESGSQPKRACHAHRTRGASSPGTTGGGHASEGRSHGRWGIGHQGHRRAEQRVPRRWVPRVGGAPNGARPRLRVVRQGLACSLLRASRAPAAHAAASAFGASTPRVAGRASGAPGKLTSGAQAPARRARPAGRRACAVDELTVFLQQSRQKVPVLPVPGR